MTRRIFLLQVTLTVLLLRNAAAQQLSFDGITTVRISYENPEGIVPVLARVHHLFPAWDISYVADTIAVNDEHIVLRCPVRAMQEGYLSISNKEITLFMIPGDTVDVMLRGTFGAPSIAFGGKTKPIQEYYIARSARFPTSDRQLTINAGMSSANLKEFKFHADSLYAMKLEFWNHYPQRKELPEWFIEYESDAIAYSNAQTRLYILTYQTIVQQKDGDLPRHYFDFLSAVPLVNEHAVHNFNYLPFVREYFRYKAGVGTERYDQEIEFEMAKATLGDKLGDFYTLYSISGYLIGDPVKVRSDLMNRTFLPSHQYLKDYLLSRADAYTEKLRPGDLAPDFFLVDRVDSLLSLSQFRGKIVYLSFWFPGCKGCIREFPFENALVEEFEGKPVEIISICTRASKSKWIAAVEKYGLKTISLYANESWQMRLEEKYGVNVYPHHVLISGDGRIIENYATRPSEGVEEKIQKAINASER